MARAARKEITLHTSAAALIRATWPRHLPWTHFPAGEHRDARTGAKLKAMGLAPGWPDFLFVMPNGKLAGMELKFGAGELSTEQIDVRQAMLACKCGYAVCRSLDEVEATLSKWLALFGLSLRGRIVA